MAKKFKTQQYTGTVEGAIEGAKSEIESLKDEMEQWRDGMEDSLSHTSKYEEVSECCDYLSEVYDKLEEVDLSDLPGEIGDAPVTYTESLPYGRKPMPRWMRLSNAQSMIDAAKSSLEAFREDEASNRVDSEDEEAIDALRESMAEETGEELEERDWETPIDALDEALSGCDNISFPGMY